MVSSTLYSGHFYKAPSSGSISKLSALDIFSTLFYVTQLTFWVFTGAVAAGYIQLVPQNLAPKLYHVCSAFCPRMTSLSPHLECLWESTQPLWGMCKPLSVKALTPHGSPRVNAPVFCIFHGSFSTMCHSASEGSISNFH